MCRYTTFLDALVGYETELWNTVDARLLAEHGISLARLDALRVVRVHAGACRVQEVANDLAITIGAASKLVDRLERDGLAHRVAHPNDRRSSLVALTEQGDEMHDQGCVALEDQLGSLLSGRFSENELPELTGRLNVLRDDLRVSATIN
ncbi:MarR family winged helix-turn-helix transcriptional regulator [Arthrobacter sp. 2MCAF14]|uniref:MarR family winged helix-turn-helix transcriptional regulator n=1 Tax=Arthrobacter sp. 2MCAF14 TaxID=3232982 RepID=UPI003F9329C1